MSSTFSSLKFELIGVGEQSGTWGTTTNTNIGTAIEQAIVGMATLEAADFTANVCTLTLANTNAAQDARALCLKIDAAALSAPGTVNVPAIQKPYLVINAAAHEVTVKSVDRQVLRFRQARARWSTTTAPMLATRSVGSPP